MMLGLSLISNKILTNKKMERLFVKPLFLLLNIFMYSKYEQRIIQKEKRKSLNMEKQSKEIINNLFTLQEFHQAKNIFTYIALKNEVSTDSILELIDKNIFVPKIHGQEIIMTKYTPLSLIKNKYGILEPEKITPTIPGEKDIIIIPALAVDKSFTRLGYGGGYYDRYLRDKKGIKIVLIPECLFLAELPADEFDVCCDIVITEKKIIRKIV